MAARVPGVWCIEGEWSPRRTDRRSVKPLLETVEACAGVRYVHNPAPSRDAFDQAVRRWGQKQYAAYSIGYFALHGSPGAVHVGRSEITLGELADQLDGAAGGRFLYFGSCSTLDLPEDELRAFRLATGAKALIGYRGDIEWLESAAFDLILLEAAAEFETPGQMDRWMWQQHEGFCWRLGFQMDYRRSRRTASAAS